jgi:predicted cupin superfamily sugar epimerase
MDKADFYIEQLKLIPHPEGGYFREIYRSDEALKEDALPHRYKGNRVFSTSIYFLLKGEQRSLLHKLKSDEIWHFYAGSSVKLYTIDSKGKVLQRLLGRNIDAWESMQLVIKRGYWFCAEVLNVNSFSLFGCTVVPGFDFSDFELGDREELLQLYPQHEELVKKFTK